MASYRPVDGFKSPAGRLPVQRDQLRAQRSVTSMGSLLLLPYTILYVYVLPRLTVDRVSLYEGSNES